MNKRTLIATSIVGVVLLIDQCLKIWIKTNLNCNEALYPLGIENSWFQLRFVENPGMAWGLSFGGYIGKLVLSLFRIFAVGYLIYFIRQLIRKESHLGLIACTSLVLAGAAGNIIDGIFYGVFFKETFIPKSHAIKNLIPIGEGYAPPLFGNVVDMFYFPFYEGILPSWIPIMGGKYFEFFQHIFNIADASISLAVICILFFQKSLYTAYYEFSNGKIPDYEKEILNEVQVLKKSNPFRNVSIDYSLNSIQKIEESDKRTEKLNLKTLQLYIGEVIIRQTKLAKWNKSNDEISLLCANGTSISLEELFPKDSDYFKKPQYLEIQKIISELLMYKSEQNTNFLPSYREQLDKVFK